MGSKSKYIIIFLLFTGLLLKAQSQLDFSYVDSATYSFYLAGDWEDLINLGDEALSKNIDFKYLRQRLGHAWFLKGDFMKSQKHFKKANNLDSYDLFTQQYLYYSLLYSGQEDAAALAGGRMNKDLRKSLSIDLFKTVESVDAEYNFKYAGTSLRSNPQYVHIGISSRLGSRVGIYQMISNYYQTITIQPPLQNGDVNNDQFEYYGLLRINLADNLLLKSAYHFLNTTYSDTKTRSHLGYFGLTTSSSNLLLGIDASLFYADLDYITQFGLQAGINSIGLRRIYFNGNLSLLEEDSEIRVIYTQKAGLKILRRWWLEGNAVLGNLNNYNDFSSMYVYNSIDPITLRAGTTLYFYSGKHLSVWLNFAYEKKQFYENINKYYNQFSYLGGIKWKI